MYDSIEAVRGMTAGSNSFTKSGHNLHPTDILDTITLGSTAKGSHKLNVYGSARVYGDFYEAGTLRLTGPYNTGTGTIVSTGINLTFDDGNNTPVTLTQLVNGGKLFTSVASTRYTTDTTYNFT